MRSTYLIAGAVVLALLAAGVLFGTDFFKKNPLGKAADEAPFVTQASEAASRGGFAALFSEQDARRWRLAGGHRLERFSLDQSGAVFARLSSTVALDKTSTDWPAQGLTVIFPREFNNAMAGRTVEVGFAARAAPANGSDVVAVVYATQQAGNSGWKEFKLGADFQLYSFKFKVPKVETAFVNGPIVAISADPTGAGRAVELMGVFVKPAE